MSALRHMRIGAALVVVAVFLLASVISRNVPVLAFFPTAFGLVAGLSLTWILYVRLAG